MFKVRDILGLPAAYRLFGWLVGGKARAVYVREYINPRPGDRVFDMGCGPGDILAYLPGVEYVGIDLSAKYVRAAQARYGTLGTFHCQDAVACEVAEPGSFDIVMANGLLHHLDDEEVRTLLQSAARALKPTGRLVTFDGGFVPGQSRIARLLLRKDRGKHVRSPEAYAALAAEVFGTVHSAVRHDLMRIPYTQVILTCSDAAAVARHAA